MRGIAAGCVVAAMADMKASRYSAAPDYPGYPVGKNLAKDHGRHKAVPLPVPRPIPLPTLSVGWLGQKFIKPLLQGNCSRLGRARAAAEDGGGVFIWALPCLPLDRTVAMRTHFHRGNFPLCGDLAANSAANSRMEIPVSRSNAFSPTWCCLRWHQLHKLITQISCGFRPTPPPVPVLTCAASMGRRSHPGTQHACCRTHFRWDGQRKRFSRVDSLTSLRGRVMRRPSDPLARAGAAPIRSSPRRRCGSCSPPFRRSSASWCCTPSPSAR